MPVILPLLLAPASAGADQYAYREENFATIMNSGAGDEPRFINDTLPGEFREVIDAGNFVVH